ncbi:hypothetical protein [Actinomadura litoris]|uniref:hypothetical protein n=1 Tax=Actinomadura litoris TaxID=2678616 RepID=UPI001FA77C37|nr:hypothetical protein [Actinomadura litoris]
MDDHLRPAADEDALVVPGSWRRRSYCRRGGVPGPAVRIDRSAGAALRARVRDLDAAAPLADRPGVDPGMAEAARAHLAGAADARGAAVVAALLAQDARDDEAGTVVALAADAWVGEHGLPFAACAFAELSQILWSASGLTPIEDRRATGYGGASVASTPAAGAGARLRRLLAAAPDDVHRAALDRLAGCRRTATQRAVVSFLDPTRLDWVGECCAAPPDPGYEADFWWMLYSSLGSPAHLDALAPYGVVHHYVWDRPVLVALAEGVGAAAAPLLARAFDADAEMTALRKLILEVLAVLPGDAAFQALVDRADQKYVGPALAAAARRFPRRAARLRPGPVRADRGGPPDAPEEVLPRVLVDPPWLRAADPPSGPPVVEGLAPPVGAEVRWEPGEQDRWARTDERHRPPARADWDALAATFRDGGPYMPADLGILLHGPEDVVRPLLADRELRPWEAEIWMAPTLARFEAAALPVALAAAGADPAGHGAPLLPFLDAAVARLMGGCLTRVRERALALAWFDRHGPHAVPYLVPDAVGRPGPGRRRAEAALRLLAGRHGPDPVVDAAARAHGGAAADAVRAVLAVDPLDLLPARVPWVGGWADVEALPRVRLRGRDDALPTGAARHLLTMLALSEHGEAYAGVRIVAEACDAESLAAFGWALFQQWREGGAPARDGWALAQLGWLGDDATVRALAPVVRAWPGEGGHARAVAGLDALAAIGTDVALTHLDAIARTVRFKGLRARARERVEQVAAARGLTPEQLGTAWSPTSAWTRAAASSSTTGRAGSPSPSTSGSSRT